MGLPLITRAEYKAYVGITSPTSDAVIDALIPKVSELVKTYCRRTFVDYVNDAKFERSNGGYGPSIYLKEYPVLAVTSFEYSYDYGNTYTALIEYTDYAVDYEESCLVNIAATPDFPKLVNGYQFSYTAGYEVLPEDLKLAVMDLVKYYISNDMSVHSPKAPGTNSVQVEYITNAGFPSHIKRVLDLYKASWD